MPGLIPCLKFVRPDAKTAGCEVPDPWIVMFNRKEYEFRDGESVGFDRPQLRDWFMHKMILAPHREYKRMKAVNMCETFDLPEAEKTSLTRIISEMGERGEVVVVEMKKTLLTGDKNPGGPPPEVLEREARAALADVGIDRLAWKMNQLDIDPSGSEPETMVGLLRDKGVTAASLMAEWNARTQQAPKQGKKK